MHDTVSLVGALREAHMCQVMTVEFERRERRSVIYASHIAAMIDNHHLTDHRSELDTSACEGMASKRHFESSTSKRNKKRKLEGTATSLEHGYVV